MRPRLSQLHQSEATDGQVPVWDAVAGQWVPGGSGGTSGGVDLDSTKVSELPPDDAAVWLPAGLADITISASSGDRQIVLAPSEAWEEDSIQEVSVWFEGGLFHMLYSGGWTNEQFGYATAEHPLGPWTKYAGNPIFGFGNGGESASVGRGTHFIDDDGQHYHYYAHNPLPTPTDGSLFVATGAPPSLTKVGAALSVTGSILSYQNVAVVKDGSTYRMIFEAHASSGPTWQLGYATATSPLGPFTVNAFPLPSLQIGTGSYSGPYLSKSATGWSLFYHAGTTSSLPTDIYRATSTNLTTWTQDAVAPFVSRVVNPPEVDQVADPWYLVTDFGAFLFWEGVDNTAEESSVMCSRAQALGAPRWFDGDTWQTEWPGEVTQAELDAAVAAVPEQARDAVGTALTAGTGITVTVNDGADTITIASTVSGSSGELLMADGVSAPPVPIENEAQTDWLYAD